MRKDDIMMARAFMKREEGSQLVFDTGDDQVFLKDPSKLFFTDDFLVINEFPKVRLKYHHVEKILLSYESDLFIEYDRLVNVVKDSWINNFESYIYILYEDMYYYIKRGMLISSSNNGMTCLLDGEETYMKYQDIDELKINIMFLEDNIIEVED